MDLEAFNLATSRLRVCADVLVEYCDGAKEDDQMGYSRADATFGRVLCGTPLELWTPDLFVQGVKVLSKYRKTQLTQYSDLLLELKGLVNKGESLAVADAVKARAAYIKPRLGIEDDLLTVVSTGFGGSSDQKKAFKKALDDAGFEWSPERSAHVHRVAQLTAGSLPAAQVAALLDLVRLVAPPEEAVRTRVRYLEERARPIGCYIQALPEPVEQVPDQGWRFYVAFPFDRDVLEAFKQASHGEIRRFSERLHTGDRYITEKVWIVDLRPVGATPLLNFAEAYGMPLVGDTRERLNRMVQVQAEIAAGARRVFGPELSSFVRDGKNWLVVPVPYYNPTFSTWLKKQVPKAWFTKPPAVWTLPMTAVTAVPELFQPDAECWQVWNMLPYRVPPAVQALVAAEGVRLRAEQQATEQAEQRAEVLQVASRQADSTYQVRDGLRGELKPFQRAGVSYCRIALAPGKGVMIGDEMGLGKTIQALATLHDNQSFPAIVVCGATLKHNWYNEATKWLPEDRRAVITKVGAPLPQADLYIVNFEQLRRLLPDLLALGAKALIIDEFHQVKTARAERTKACLRLVENIQLRLGLSGTPIVNRSNELVEVLRILGRLEDFGGQYQYTQRYCDGHYVDGRYNTNGSSNAEELNKRLRATCYIRREKSQVLPELPPLQSTVVEIELSEQQRADYYICEVNVVEWLKKQGRVGLRNADKRAEALRQITALRQAVALAKLDAQKQWLDSFMTEVDKVIVFAHHVEIQDRIVQHWQTEGRQTCSIMASDTQEERNATVLRFQNDPAMSAVLCSLRVASEGLTLTAAHHVVQLEMDWTPGRHDQAIARAHRMGQTMRVNAYYLLSPGTIDDDMWALQESKRTVIKQVVTGEKTEGGEETLLDELIKNLLQRRNETLPEMTPVRALAPVSTQQLILV